MRMCRENAGNSADECLSCTFIATSAIFSSRAFCRIAFPVIANDIILRTYHRNVEIMVLEACEHA
jgi:hypothetical protein